MLLSIQPQANRSSIRPVISILILLLGIVSHVEALSSIAYPRYRNNHDRRRESFGPSQGTAPLPLPSPSLWRNDTSAFLDYPRFSLSSFRKPTVINPPQQNFRVFCDLDGVLVDFCHGISQAFPDAAPKMNSQNVDAIPRNVLWDRVKSADAFFEHLPWCTGGRELWEAIAPLRPSILTGVPAYCDRAPRDEKFAWCLRELASDRLLQFQHIDKAGRLRQHYPVKNELVHIHHHHNEEVGNRESLDIDWTCRVITCWSERKHHESGKNAVLIDDRIDLKDSWEAAGGIFIHHTTGNTGATLQQLRDRGILPTVRP